MFPCPSIGSEGLLPASDARLQASRCQKWLVAPPLAESGESEWCGSKAPNLASLSRHSSSST